MYIADPDRFVRAFESAQRDAVGRERRRVAFKRRTQATKRNRIMKFRLDRVAALDGAFVPHQQALLLLWQESV